MDPLAPFSDTLPERSTVSRASPTPLELAGVAIPELRSTVAGPPPAGVAEDEVWFVCHTRPRCEKQFAILMEAERFEHFLPLVPSVRRYVGGTKRFSKPLFPGYVFARIALNRKARIYQRELLARAIPVIDQASFLRQIEDVRMVIATGYEVAAMPLLTKGLRVKVLGGPLHGLEGMIDDAANPRGIVVSVDILRQGVLVKVPVEQLKILH